MVPGARGEERGGLRCRSVRHECGQELHLDDHGAVVAHVGASRRRDEKGERLMEISRRNALKIIGATPVAAGLGIAGADAAQAPAAHEHGAAQKTAPAARRGSYKPKFFTAHEWATVT